MWFFITDDIARIYLDCAGLVPCVYDPDLQIAGTTAAVLFDEDTYQARSLQNLSRTLFDDTPASLVARLVDDAGLTEADLEEIRALVERRLQNDSG